MSNTSDMANLVRQTLESGKGEDIKILPTERQSGGLFGWMIIATARSSRHAAALAERVRLAVKGAGADKSHAEVSEGKSWILVDTGDVVTHIMQAEARARYDLEGLWGMDEERR